MPRDFGDQLARRLHAEHRSILRARTLRQTEVIVTEVRSDCPTHQRSDPLPPEDAFVVAVQLRDYPAHEWWEDGRRAPDTSLRAGQATLYDLKRDPRFTINNPFHSIHFHLPRRFLDAIADDARVGRISGLDYTPGAGIDDSVLMHLALSLRGALARPAEASRLLVESVTTAVATHVATTYGHMGAQSHRAGGLSPWQRRQVCDAIEARLDGEVTIADLARESGLSRSYFTQAFRQTMGLTPHRWLMQRRAEKAMSMLLRDFDLPLAQVALACGFAGQSHFARVFHDVVGCTPSQWRRQKGARTR